VQQRGCCGETVTLEQASSPVLVLALRGSTDVTFNVRGDGLRAGTDASDRVRSLALLAWSGLFGAVSFELFGHFVGSVTDAEAFFDDAMRDLARLIGL